MYQARQMMTVTIKNMLFMNSSIATHNTLKLVAAVSYVFDSIYSEGTSFYRCVVGRVELDNSQFQ